MKSRLHETGTYKNLQMEIVAYREAMDIDVEFSNGFILQHTRYYNFQHRIFPMCVIRYHETSTALNGMVMTIVAYRTTTDIDVEFADGIIVQHRSYRPEINPETMYHRVGEIRMANCGLEMEIIAYRTAHDMDVRFSTGEIKEHVAYGDFLSGKIKPVTTSPVGMVRTAKNGLWNTVVHVMLTSCLKMAL